jgi:hypothetical protein
MAQGRGSYYTSRARKVGDFLLGFFGTGVIALGILSILTSSLALAAMPLGWVVVLIFLGSRGRGYIVLGSVAAALTPFLLVGACLVIMGAPSFH